MDKSIAPKYSILFCFFPAQCNCKKRAGGREPAAGLRHRRAPRCACHLASHHFSCQVIPEIIFHLCLSYKRGVIWFTDDGNYFIALDSFSFQERHRHHPSLLSVALSKGKQDNKK